MKFILAEKPSVAKSFAEALGVPYSNGYYRNSTYVITNCVGHLYELYVPDEYDSKYKTWKTSDLPIIPREYKYKTIKQAEHQAKLVRELLHTHGDDIIVIATDAGREGELIARIVLQNAGIIDYSNCYRFWVSSALTPNVVMQGLADMKPLSSYDTLAQQGYARQHADWLIGMNISRLLSILSKAILPCGRVQTAVLYEIYKREMEIKNFEPEPYYEYEATFSCGSAKIQAKEYVEKDGTRTTHFTDGSRDLRSCIGQPANSIAIQDDKKEECSHQLFSLTELQKEAFRVFSLTPEQTLASAQKLYEEYKCLSYPRTPSRVMGSSDEKLITNVYSSMSALYPDRTHYVAPNLLAVTNKRLYNDEQLEDHHALIPLKAIPDTASENEKKIFDLVVRQFFIAISRPCQYTVTTIQLAVHDHTFVCRGKKINDIGWKALQLASVEANKKAEVIDPDYTGIAFDSAICAGIEILKKKTQPKKPYRYDTLLAFMQNPKNEDDTCNTKPVGLGTPATRAEIIKNLFTNKYIDTATTNKNMFMLDKGIFLIGQILKNDILYPLIDALQTTVWEEKLKNSPEQFVSEIIDFVTEACVSIRTLPVYEKEKLGMCPQCKTGHIVEGKESFYCSDYKKGCTFAVWKKMVGTTVQANDIREMLKGNKTTTKKCTSRAGKKFQCRFALDEAYKIKFHFAERT